jgi:four helix bundle protein
MKLIHHHWELEVHKKSVTTSMEIFQASKTFPKEETYSLTDQIRRSSRAVAAAIAEAWRGRKYEAVFVNKLNEAEREAAETQTWLEFAVKCGYLKAVQGRELHRACDEVIAMLVTMGNRPEKWLMHKSRALAISDLPTH